MVGRICKVCGLYDCAEPHCGDADNGSCGNPDCQEIYRNSRMGCQACAPAPKLIDGRQYMVQMQKGLEMMDRLRTIAGECGAVLGEGAFYDSIDMTGMTPEQLAEYGRRVREEGLGIADFGALK